MGLAVKDGRICSQKCDVFATQGGTSGYGRGLNPNYGKPKLPHQSSGRSPDCLWPHSREKTWWAFGKLIVVDVDITVDDVAVADAVAVAFAVAMLAQGYGRSFGKPSRSRASVHVKSRLF